MAPLERRGQEKYETLWDEMRAAGFVRMRVDGKIVQPRRAAGNRPPPQAPGRGGGRSRRSSRRSQRARASPTPSSRPSTWAAACCTSPTSDDAAASRSGSVDRYSQHFACDRCGRSFEPLTPHHFSFNSPLGWCPTCEGLGMQHGAQPGRC